MEYKDTIIQNVSDFLLWVKETNKTEVMSDEGEPWHLKTIMVIIVDNLVYAGN